MRRRYNLAHLILVSVVGLDLTPIMAVVDAQARIAFVSHRDGNMEIYVMDADGQNQQRLTQNDQNDSSPSWSPDGKRIAFVSERDRNWEIYVMDADGGNQLNLTKNASEDSSPSWSPNGKRIAFMSLRDGHIIGFAPTFEIYVMDADGGNPQNLTNNPNDDRYPAWSPNGNRIVFSSEREGHFRGEVGITSELYVMDADGGNQQRLAENRRHDWFPAWSPEGKRIAFASDRKGDLENFEIYVMDADGQNEQKLTNNRDYDWDPSWSPDSKRIAFMSDRNGSTDIYVIDADGGNLQNLTNNRHSDVSPAWYVPAFAFAVSPLGKVLTMWGWLKQLDR